ncbi:MAG: hypothetical protein AABO41_26085 [Acidobacteriota bacterium]
MVLLIASIGTSALGQTAARPDRGFTPSGSYSVTDIESVSLTNGNLHLSIPLAALPPVSGGRLGLALRASYNSKLWDIAKKEHGANVLGGPNFVEDLPQLSLDGGWRIGAGYTVAFHDAREDFDAQPPSIEDVEYCRLTGNFFLKLVLTTPDGATHELRPLDYAPYQMTREYLWGLLHAVSG